MNWLRRLMAGRYGSDHLGLALVVFSIILTIVTMFIPLPLIGYISLVPLGLPPIFVPSTELVEEAS